MARSFWWRGKVIWCGCGNRCYPSSQASLQPCVTLLCAQTHTNVTSSCEVHPGLTLWFQRAALSLHKRGGGDRREGDGRGLDSLMAKRALHTLEMQHYNKNKDLVLNWDGRRTTQFSLRSVIEMQLQELTTRGASLRNTGPYFWLVMKAGSGRGTLRKKGRPLSE